MDDFKFYAGNKKELESTLNVMAESSAAVGMALGLKKYGVAHMVKGRIKKCGGEEIEGMGMVGEVIMHRYLGVEQVF